MSNSEDRLKLQTAFSLHQAGRLENAAKVYQEIISKDPKNSQAVHYLGLIKAVTGNYEQATALLQRSLAMEPQNIHFVENYATILFQTGRYKSALEISERGLRLDHSCFPVLYVKAISLYRLKRFQESLAEFDRLLAGAPNHIVALNERGSVLAELRDYDAALASCEKALAVQPQYAEAHLNKGNILGCLKRHEAALAAYDKALALKPDLAGAWAGRGQVYGHLDRYGEALLAYDRALALKADFAQAWVGRGNILTAMERYAEAFAAYDRAVALDSDVDYAPGARLFAKRRLCDWSNLEVEAAQLLSMIRQHKPASTPFDLLPLASSPEDQQQCAQRYVRDQPRFPPLWRGEVYAHDRIRVAYLSADFREHATMSMAVGLFERHDRSRFEVTAISFGANDDSAMRHRLEGAFERFIDVRGKSEAEIADLIRRLEIDIAVDLMGFTRGNRLGVLARRAAPIQVNFLGYAGTMGCEYFDYIIADSTVIAEEHFAFFSEQVVSMPDNFLPNDDARPIAERTPTRSELELPEHGFVFCGFNQSFKISPTVFDVWMRLLQKVDGSVLWLSGTNAAAADNLRREAERRGVTPERLIFAPRVALAAEHLARHRQADLFLDTLHYNAHSTASDALWAGLPVITCLGSTFAGRVAASLCRAIGLAELVTTSVAEYEALALQIATDAALCASLKDKLAHNRRSYPLFDNARFARNIEQAYLTMFGIQRRGEAPRSFAVEPA